MVVWHHTTMMQNERLDHARVPWLAGGAGVDLFFVISGFVMVLSSKGLKALRDPARIFVARRLERIVPMYWLVTTVKLLLPLVISGLAVKTESVRHIVLSYLFVPSANGEGAMHPVLIVGWTLNFEMLFYLIFAVGLGLRARLVPYLTAALTALSVVGWLTRRTMPSFLWTVDPLLLEFLYGVLLAHFAQRLEGARGWMRWLWIGLGVAGFLTIVDHPGEAVFQHRAVVWGVPALMIVACAVALEEWIGGRVPRWMLELGDASYSIYLTHTLIVAGLGMIIVRDCMPWPSGWLVEAIACVVICVVVAEGVYRGVELPIIRFFHERHRTAALAI